MFPSDYLDKIGFWDLTVANKVRYLAFYYTKTNSVREFSLDQVREWFYDLNLPEPDRTGLFRTLNLLRTIFVKSKNKESFCLHGNVIRKLEKEHPEISSNNKPKLKSGKHDYINPDRIKALSSLKSTNFDLSKLIRLCEELNIAHHSECYFSVMMLVRAIIDHVPPLFCCPNFSGVSNNYKGAASFKKSMKHLEESSRNIADSYLHLQIRKKEGIPNITQIDFTPDLDVLLDEIIRILS